LHADASDEVGAVLRKHWYDACNFVLHRCIATERDALPGSATVDHTPNDPPTRKGFGNVSSLGLFVVQLILIVPAMILDWLLIGDRSHPLAHLLLSSWPAMLGIILGIVGNRTVRAKGERYAGLFGIILNGCWTLLAAYVFFVSAK
jgi:hypothetical protein